MCKSKMAINVSSPSRTPRADSKPTTPRHPRSEPPSPSPSSRRAVSNRSQLGSQPPSTSSDPYPSTSTSIHYSTSTTLLGSSSLTSRSSLTSLRDSLPETPNIYDISEIRAATNSFLAKNFSSSSSAASWRASLRGKDVVIFQRKLRSASLQPSHLKNVLSQICRSHHMSIIKLLGACISGEHIYLVYEHVSGANLALCLRNPRNPNFTVLATWMSRMQIATDIAHGLDYIHNNTGLSVSLVHKHIKSTSFIVTEPSFNAKICHFGTAQLCGEIDYTSSFRETDDGAATKSRAIDAIIEEEEEQETKPVNRRSDSRRMQFEGTRGYMSPEFQATGIVTQKSDVYAFGVVILELLSGEEPLKYKYEKESGEFRRTAVIETAKEAVDGGEAKVRRWIDRRLRDSFPVDVAEKMIRLGLDCVNAEADQRPNMRRVAGKISKLYLESENWSDRFKNRGDGSFATLEMSMVGPRE